MLGAGLQFNRNRNGDDRFYNAAKARRSQSQRFSSNDHVQRVQSDAKPESRCVTGESPKSKKPVNWEETKETPASPSCNLDRFLGAVTPSTTAQCLSKTTMRDWRTCDIEFQNYFVLGDLWESYKEWSAYGAGVPLILNDKNSAVQYYVPYLSGIQLYGDSSKSSVKTRRAGEDSDGDSSSETSSDSEQERNCFNALTGLGPGPSPLSTYYHNNNNNEGFSSDESESGNSQSCLLFEYLEHDQPYGREPLYDKISDLAIIFPELKTLRSCDLLPTSWISVAWYPIYRIPMGPTLKDLDACFLTFHFLHTTTTGPQNIHAPIFVNPSEIDDIAKILLPVFGLASYKFSGSLWTPNGGHERHLSNSLLQSAENWLTLLQVNHPDFLFFQRTR